jgi:hypothetical protein
MRNVSDDDDPGPVADPEVGTGQTGEDQRYIQPACPEPGVRVEEHVDAFVDAQHARVEQVGSGGGHEIGARGGPFVSGKSK